MTTQRDSRSRATSATVRDIARCPGDSSTPPSPGHAVTPPHDALGQLTPDQRKREESLALGHPEWIRPPGYSRYEASRHSLWTRGEDGRPVLAFGGIRNPAGVLLRPRVGNKGYLLINLIDDTGVKRTLTVQKVILRAHAGDPPPGQEALHENDDSFDNRYPSRLYYGSHVANEQQKRARQRRESFRELPRLRRLALTLLRKTPR
jgi:hypothetical protein